MRHLYPLLPLALAASCLWAGDRPHRAGEEEVLLSGIPAIPGSLAGDLERFNELQPSHFSGWSADGRHLLIKTRLDGVHQLQFIPGAGKAGRRLTWLDEPVGEVAVQPRGGLIAMAIDEGGNGFDQVFLLDPESLGMQRLTDGASLNNRMVWSRDGSLLAYRSTRRNGARNDIWIMDPERPGDARLVFEAPDGALWKPVDFSRNGQSLLIQHYAGITDSRIYMLDLDSGESRLLAGDPLNGTSNVAAGFDATDQGILFVTNQRGGSAEIAHLSLTGEAGLRFMSDAITWDVTRFRLSPDRSRGAFITNEEGISRLYLFEPGEMKTALARKVPDGVISSLGFSPDGQRLAFSISSARNPNEAMVLNLGSKPLKARGVKRWTRADRGLAISKRFIEPDLVHYPAPMLTDDSTMLMPAFVYRPRARRPHPVVIYIHGGPEGQFRPSFNAMIQMWLDTLRVAVIAPNVRGSLGYGERYLSMDDGMLRENAVMDIGALLDWIDNHRDFDGSRVAVYGASYGGYMALASSVHFGDRLKAVISKAGISHFVTYLENTQDYRRDLRRIEYGDERDAQLRAFLDRISPLNNVDRIQTPLLIAQGQNDPVVPASESEQIVEAMRGRGVPVWYMNALNEGHSYEKQENRDLFQRVARLFLETYLLED
ncbi:MAG: alpha/beta fold hydrolase [Xanthomonadales bacterium]|nr:alpha/beta fold hydrolase [Xanthomonadales bacterium]